MKNKKDKIVIYTAIAGGYDNLIQHAYKSKDFDYVCFTDQKIENPGMWKIRFLDFNSLDNVRNAKFYKIFPDKLFPEYDYSIWIDGNIDILDAVFEERIYELITDGEIISANIHGRRNCVYKEGKACIKAEKDDPEIISRQLEYLKKNKFPKKYGLYEMNIIFRKHNNSEVVKLMNDWWGIILNYSKRDQLSFPYILYKNNINCETMFKTNARLLNSFAFKNHGFNITSELYYDLEDGFKRNCVISNPVIVSGDNKFSVKYDFSTNKEVKNIKFVPVSGKMCKLKISDLIVSYNEIEKKYTQSEINELINHNDSNHIVLTAGKPEINININGNIKKIEILGELHFIEKLTFVKKIKNKIISILPENYKKIIKKYWWKIGVKL